MREAPVSLSYPCDACGHHVGAGLKYCPKCKIALCLQCSLQLLFLQKNPMAVAKCPMCGEYFPVY